eukprot:TRINITY_DN5238_c0_g1_i3.p1 TRINITY_DN5238_c0_g1~~TRINITY_DN5238_c0_g1_i3.p1  ORF type:complete len:1053 (+),score=194.35 TRINITY_DN5238_c0_g1_i3:745-3903(+)
MLIHMLSFFRELLRRVSEDLIDAASLAYVYGPLFFGQHLKSGALSRYTPSLSIELTLMMIQHLEELQDVPLHEDATIILATVKYNLGESREFVEELKQTIYLLEEEASHYRIVIADLNRKINGLLHPKDTLVSPRLSTSSSLSAEGFYQLENQPSAHPLQIVNAQLQQERGRNAQLTKILLNIRTDYLEMISNLRKQLSQNGNDRLISSDATKTCNISVDTTSGPTSAHEKKSLQPANHQSPIHSDETFKADDFDASTKSYVEFLAGTLKVLEKSIAFTDIVKDSPVALDWSSPAPIEPLITTMPPEGIQQWSAQYEKRLETIQILNEERIQNIMAEYDRHTSYIDTMMKEKDKVLDKLTNAIDETTKVLCGVLSKLKEAKVPDVYVGNIQENDDPHSLAIYLGEFVTRMSFQIKYNYGRRGETGEQSSQTEAIISPDTPRQVESTSSRLKSLRQMLSLQHDYIMKLKKSHQQTIADATEVITVAERTFLEENHQSAKCTELRVAISAFRARLQDTTPSPYPLSNPPSVFSTTDQDLDDAKRIRDSDSASSIIGTPRIRDVSSGNAHDEPLDDSRSHEHGGLKKDDMVSANSEPLPSTALQRSSHSWGSASDTTKPADATASQAMVQRPPLKMPDWKGMIFQICQSLVQVFDSNYDAHLFKEWDRHSLLSDFELVECFRQIRDHLVLLKGKNPSTNHTMEDGKRISFLKSERKVGVDFTQESTTQDDQQDVRATQGYMELRRLLDSRNLEYEKASAEILELKRVQKSLKERILSLADDIRTRRLFSHHDLAVDGDEMQTLKQFCTRLVTEYENLRARYQALEYRTGNGGYVDVERTLFSPSFVFNSNRSPGGGISRSVSLAEPRGPSTLSSTANTTSVPTRASSKAKEQEMLSTPGSTTTSSPSQTRPSQVQEFSSKKLIDPRERETLIRTTSVMVEPFVFMPSQNPKPEPQATVSAFKKTTSSSEAPRQVTFHPNLSQSADGTSTLRASLVRHKSLTAAEELQKQAFNTGAPRFRAYPAGNPRLIGSQAPQILQSTAQQSEDPSSKTGSRA